MRNARAAARRPARWALSACAAAALAAAPALTAQQVFRSSVQTVPIYATVLDKSGRLITDLEQKDFEIDDNGQPQTITVFRKDVQPFTAMVALDTSGSMTFNLDRLKAAAEAFVVRLLGDDRARIMNFDDKIVTSPTFTGDRDALVEYLHDDIDWGNGTRLWDATGQALTALANVPGRRVIVLFTDGQDEGSRLTNFNAVLTRARDEDVMVYSIGFHSVIPAAHLSTSPDGGIKVLAAETGGGFFELSKAADLASTFTRVADELHRQYVLGFTPQALDGKVHTLRLRVKIPNLTARGRTSYVASPTQ